MPQDKRPCPGPTLRGRVLPTARVWHTSKRSPRPAMVRSRLPRHAVFAPAYTFVSCPPETGRAWNSKYHIFKITPAKCSLFSGFETYNIDTQRLLT